MSGKNCNNSRLLSQVISCLHRYSINCKDAASLCSPNGFMTQTEREMNLSCNPHTHKTVFYWIRKANERRTRASGSLYTEFNAVSRLSSCPQLIGVIYSYLLVWMSDSLWIALPAYNAMTTAKRTTALLSRSFCRMCAYTPVRHLTGPKHDVKGPVSGRTCCTRLLLSNEERGSLPRFTFVCFHKYT